MAEPRDTLTKKSLLKQVLNKKSRLVALASPLLTKEVLLASLDLQNTWNEPNQPELMAIVNHRLLDSASIEAKFLEITSSTRKDRQVSIFLLQSKYATAKMFEVAESLSSSDSAFSQDLTGAMLGSPNCRREVALRFTNHMILCSYALSNPNLTESDLREHYTHSRAHAWLVVANVNCPPDLTIDFLDKTYPNVNDLIKMVKSMPTFDPRCRLLLTKSFPISYLLRVQTRDINFTCALLTLPSYPLNNVYKIAQEYKEYVVHNPSCPQRILLELAVSPPMLSNQALLGLAKNPNACPKSLLAVVSAYPATPSQLWAKLHPNAPPYLSFL